MGLWYIGNKRVGAVFKTSEGRDIYGVATWRNGGIVETVGVTVS